jgi:isocitrate/isopropylmalate dehydrogenase
MMLEWLAQRYGEKAAYHEGERLEASMIKLLDQNKKTIDIGGNLTTSEFTRILSNSMYEGQGA